MGPGYTSVWHRDPAGNGTFYSDIAPEQGCARYSSKEGNGSLVAPVRISGAGPFHSVLIVDNSVIWHIRLTETVASRVLNVAAKLVPESWWRNRSVLALMGLAARFTLRTGTTNLTGRTPNNHQF